MSSGLPPCFFLLQERHQFIWLAKYKKMVKPEFSKILARRCQVQHCRGCWSQWQELETANPQSWAESTELIRTSTCLLPLSVQDPLPKKWCNPHHWMGVPSSFNITRDNCPQTCPQPELEKSSFFYDFMSSWRLCLSRRVKVPCEKGELWSFLLLVCSVWCMLVGISLKYF